MDSFVNGATENEGIKMQVQTNYS